MKNALALAAVLAAAPAAAQPVAPEAPLELAHTTCAVTIARAPDDVRPIVEQWVRAEPKCTTALEVRIVPTQGGLYLLARDEHGRVRERVVPDAQSAGVLVASWVAADASATPTPFDVRQPAPAPAVTPFAPTPEAAPAATPATPPAGSPDAHVEAGPAAAPVIVAAAAAPAGAAKTLALGGMFAMSGSGGGGIRGELDLKSRKYATLGIAASASTWGTMAGNGTINTFDAKLLAYLSANTRRGRWHLRAAVGAGAVYTRASLQQPALPSFREAEGVFPAGEVSLAFGREITDRWQLYAGPIVSVYAQSYQFDEMGPGYYSSSSEARDLEAMFIFGMRHQL